MIENKEIIPFWSYFFQDLNLGHWFEIICVVIKTNIDKNINSS